MAPRVYLVDILSSLFAIGSWACVNGIWVELPLFVQVLPEGWSLPSYLSAMITISNLAPISYSVLNYYYPSVVTEKRGIYATAGIGIVSTLLLALFWKYTSYFWGQNRSTALLGLVFLFGMVDCSSRVLYAPFMSAFRDIYLTSFFIGEGLSALLPSLVALLQGVGGIPECRPVNQTLENGTISTRYEPALSPALFSVEAFFYILLIIVVVSALAFNLLNWESLVKGALAPVPVSLPAHAQSDSDSDAPPRAKNLNGLELEPVSGSAFAVNPLLPNPNWFFMYAVIMQLVICFVSNGIFPSIQSFSSLPYGNLPYHLVVTLSTMANPIVCFLFFVLPRPTTRSINGAGALVTLVSVYVLATALMSPAPPMVGKFLGEILLVLSWVLQMGLYTYMKVSLATLLRAAAGKRGLFWFGASTQIGSGVGSIIAFLVVNFTNIFKSYDICEFMK